MYHHDIAVDISLLLEVTHELRVQLAVYIYYIIYIYIQA